MKYHHFNNQKNDLTLACPGTGRLLYDQGRLLVEENKHYGISLILLPLDLLARALEKPAQWEAWQEQRRLSITPAKPKPQPGKISEIHSQSFANLRKNLPAKSKPPSLPEEFQSITIRPSRYGEDWPENPPESETITLSKISADPRAFAEAHQKLSVDTSLLGHPEKMEFLNAARATLREAPQPNDLPSLSALHLTDNVIDAFAQRGYDDPIYHIAEDDALYFDYLRAVPDNSLEQAMAYFKTLPDSYQLYGVSCVKELGGESETNLHLFE